MGNTLKCTLAAAFRQFFVCSFEWPWPGATSISVQLLYKALHYAHKYQLGLQTM